MKYLRARLWLWLALIAILVASLVTTYLNRVPFVAWLDTCLLSGIIISILIWVDALRYYRRLNLYKRADQVRNIDLGETHFEAGDTLLIERVQALEQTLQTREVRAKARADEQLETLQLWTHQIKTPLTGLDMLLQVQPIDGPQARAQIASINRYLEMVLVYLKLDAVNADLVFESLDLGVLVKQLVRELAPLFIKKDLAVEVDDLPTFVGDSQWLRFIFEQLLTNAIKYSDAGTIHVFASGTAVFVQDEGRGIAASDVPRVFERGYSGENGRLSENASGLGLYLSQQVAQRMNLRLTLDSQPGVGTTVGIHFDQLE